MAEELLHCAGCNASFKARSYDPNRTYPCPKCREPLKPKEEADASDSGVTLSTQGGLRQDDDDPLIGQKIGACRIEKKLGEGGMGSVYLAKHLSLGRPSAIKVLPEGLVKRMPEAAERFVREARAAAALSHPNIVAIHNVGKAEERYFIEMECVEGQDLQELIKKEGRLSLKDATQYVRDAAKALGEAHSKKVIHRDIKPANIMVTNSGVVKVMDFGLAKNVHGADAQLTQTGAVMGTPHYMSPEQCEAHPLDGRADVYSLGATYYAALTGETPYHGTSLLEILRQQTDAPVPNVREKRPDLPKSVQQVIEKAMAKKADDRYATCADMIADLEAVLAEVEASDAAVPATQRIKAAKTTGAGGGLLRSKPALVAACVLAAAVVLVVGQMALSSRGKEETAAKEPPSATADADNRAPASPEPSTLEAVASAASPAKTESPPSLVPRAKSRSGAEQTTPADVDHSKTTRLARLSKPSQARRFEWLGYCVLDRPEVMAEIAPYSNFVFLWRWIGNENRDELVDAARKVGLKVVLEIPEEQSWQEAEAEVSPFIQKHQDAVVAVCWNSPYNHGWTAERLAADARLVKEAFPELQRWAEFVEKPRGGYQTQPVPPEIDLILVDFYYATSPERVRQRADDLLPEWLSKAKGRPVLHHWVGWSNRAPGPVPSTKPGTLRMCAKMARKYGLAGLSFWYYGDIQDGVSRNRGIDANPALVAEVKAVAKESGFMRQPEGREIAPIVERDVLTGAARASKNSTNPIDGSEMIFVPAGTSKMGGNLHPNQKPVHDVHVDAFHISKYEITNKQWKRFVDANPKWRKSRVNRKYCDRNYLRDWEGDSYPPDKADHPIAWVSWFAAQAYCAWAGGRLPTEAEWEKACRAGQPGKYGFGDDESKLGEHAWYKDNLDGGAHPVGQKKPNAWGIHDMHGNVCEWCSSKYVPYPYKADDGREDLRDTASSPVVRGGAAHDPPEWCRAAARCTYDPLLCGWHRGVRLCIPGEAPGRPASQPGGSQTEPTARSSLPASFTNSTDGSAMIYVPAGTFRMGSKWGNESPHHEVHVNALYVSKCEITNRQFRQFVDANPEWRKGKVESKLATSDYLKHWEDGTHPADKADHPVVYVSWSAANAYCQWAGVRLPTEAEWEYACRAGSTGAFCFGDDVSRLKDYAWFRENSGQLTHAVGQKKANAWGLHDLHGNVSEWTSSIYKDYPYKADDGREDPRDTSSPRVVRGGAANFSVAIQCRSMLRITHLPSDCVLCTGFRVVSSARPQNDAAASDALPVPQHTRASSASAPPADRSYLKKKDGSEMLYAPAGTFKMGGRLQHAGGLVHDVHVDAFYISKHEVTNKQFKEFVDATPEWRKSRIKKESHNGDYLKDWEGDSYPAGRASHPVGYVSWFAARAYCEWAGGRLPTEAEWEYACRAGSTSALGFGDDGSKLEDYAWYNENSGSATHPVGQKKANDWGLYDMPGNVWEWTSSSLKKYPYRPDDGREDEEDRASHRVMRGGSSFTNTTTCRPEHRCDLPPTSCLDRVGFRLVLSTRGPLSPPSPDSGAKASEGTPSAETSSSVPVAPGVPSTSTEARGAAAMVDLLLKITPADAEVSIDGESVALKDGGRGAALRLPPGQHTLKVSKEGHVPSEKVIDLPAEGMVGEVTLARILQQVTVHMKSGRKMAGSLVAQVGNKITITQGRGDLTLAEGQYERFELGEMAAVGESTIKVMVKTDDAKPDPTSGADATTAAKAPATTERTKRRRRQKQPKPFTNRRDGSHMIYVPEGTFRMGDPRWNIGVSDDVQVDAFYISKFEITNKQFKLFVDANPRWCKDPVNSRTGLTTYLRHWSSNTYPWDKADHPVVNVSWFAAKAYCEWAGGRLPTEAEWEYACRAGSTGTYCFGDDGSKLPDYAWCRDNSGHSTHPVGRKKANDWGLHDMHGNVMELTSSIHRDYPYNADDGREDEEDADSGRVARGGGFGGYGYACNCISAARFKPKPTSCADELGFRLAMSRKARR